MAHRSAGPLARALTQLDQYLDRLRVGHGTLLIFDRREAVPPAAERISFTADRTPSGRPVTLLCA